MADTKQFNNVIFRLKHYTSTEWTSSDPVLAEGEIGFESDTRKFKFGDGVTDWINLKYANAGTDIQIMTEAPTSADADFEVGTLWIDTVNGEVYELLATTGTTATWLHMATVDSTVAQADKWTTARNLTLAGAVVTNTQSIDGSADVTFNLVLVDSGVTAGEYPVVTVNSKGIITDSRALTADDIPDITLSQITDAGTAASRDVGTDAGEVIVVGSNGKIDSSVLPALAITDVLTAGSESEMCALDAQQGDICIRTDLSETYILTNNDPTDAANWVLIQTPDCDVLSVNGKTGVVTLTTSDIDEGTNLYYTEARATANFKENIAESSVYDLADGDNAVMIGDLLILNGNEA